MLISTFLAIFLACFALEFTAGQQQEIKLSIKPTIAGNFSAAENGNAYLTCSVEPESAKELVKNVRWLSPEGLVIPEMKSERIYVRSPPLNNGQSLVINKVKDTDSGVYTCTANVPGSDDLKASFNFLVYKDITFEDTPTEQSLIAGSTGFIKCAVRAYPAPTVSWTKDDINSITTGEGDKYKVEENGVQVFNVDESDEGMYNCFAVVLDTGKTDERKIKVEVQRLPEFVTDGQPKEGRGLEGRTVSMDCKVTGRPSPQIKWIFVPNGEDVTKLEHDEQKTMRHTVDQHTGTMTINDAKKVDQGEYKCVAENKAGLIESTAMLTIVEKPRFDVVSNVTVKEGEPATIECTVRGDPSPALQYTHEDDIVPINKEANSRFTVVENDKQLSLTINNVNRNDDGLYWCQASNEAGTERKASHITVQFKPTFQNTPMVSAKTWPENTEPVNLTCIAESIPNATIRWEKRLLGGHQHGLVSIPITETSLGYTIEQRGPSSSLLIKSASVDIYGEFECIATNELGEARHIVTLYRATQPAGVSSVHFADVTASAIRFDIYSPDEPNNLELLGYETFYTEFGTDNWANAPSRSWPIGVQYTVDGLEPGRKYQFKFFAKNALGYSVESKLYDYTMPNIGPPRPPGLIVRNDTSDEANQYLLKWQESADNGARITEYHIKYWKNGQNKDDMKPVISPAPRSQYKLTNLEAGTFYNVEITAVNSKGHSAPLLTNFTTGYASGYHVDPVDDDTKLSLPVVIAIAIAALIILLLVIDLICFFALHRGFIHFLATRCGRSEKLKHTDIEKHRQEETEISRDEKEPLTASPRTTAYVKTTTTTTFREEKEPEDKASSQ